MEEQNIEGLIHSYMYYIDEKDVVRRGKVTGISFDEEEGQLIYFENNECQQEHLTYFTEKDAIDHAFLFYQKELEYNDYNSK